METNGNFRSTVSHGFYCSVLTPSCSLILIIISAYCIPVRCISWVHQAEWNFGVLHSIALGIFAHENCRLHDLVDIGWLLVFDVEELLLVVSCKYRGESVRQTLSKRRISYHIER